MGCGEPVIRRDELARRIWDASHLTGSFRLRSGAESSEYFDKYQFESDPVLLREVCMALLPLVPDTTQVLAGLELGGVPIATIIGQVSGLPVTFVRKTAKDYGTCRVAEGHDVAGRDVLIVEDVVTSGGQVVKSADDLRRLGASIHHAICVIDRSDNRSFLKTSGIDPLTERITRVDACSCVEVWKRVLLKRVGRYRLRGRRIRQGRTDETSARRTNAYKHPVAFTICAISVKTTDTSLTGLPPLYSDVKTPALFATR